MVDCSIAEEEYHVMASTTSELIWIKSLIADLGFTSVTLMILFCHNQVTVYIASNSVFHERTKHIEVNCHYIHYQVQSKLIQTRYICTHDQLADEFTKVFWSTQFHRLLSKHGSSDLVWGGV